MTEKNGNTRGGLPARIGVKFHSEMERIKRERIKSEKSEEKISTEKISNIIIRHKLWPQIAKDLINEEEEKLKEKWN